MINEIIKSWTLKLIPYKKYYSILILLFLISVSVLGIGIFITYDAKRLKGYAEATIPVGVTKAKEECYKEGQSQDVCESITGSSSVSECNARVCWIVYASADDHSKFSASITVSRSKDGSFVVNYYRNSEPN